MKFSVIIPTYNRAHLLEQAIKSVVEQTYLSWELIVVDDGSTDNTKEIIDAYDDERIKYIYQENSERSAARNNGIKNSSGEWICFLDSDDRFLPNHLEVFYNYIQHNNLKRSFLVSGGYDEVRGKLIKKPIYKKDSGISPAKFIFDSTSITPINVCVHTHCFKEHQFPELYKKSYWEDTHLWIRLACDYEFHQLNEFTSVLSEHPGRSVNSAVELLRVNDHISLINHLFLEHQNTLKPNLLPTDRAIYIDRKYRMFLYLARKNGQLLVSLTIWWKAIKYMPSLYLWSELPKIFINFLGVRKF